MNIFKFLGTKLADFIVWQVKFNNIWRDIVWNFLQLWKKKIVLFWLPDSPLVPICCTTFISVCLKSQLLKGKGISQAEEDDYEQAF